MEKRIIRKAIGLLGSMGLALMCFGIWNGVLKDNSSAWIVMCAVCLAAEMIFGAVMINYSHRHAQMMH